MCERIEHLPLATDGNSQLPQETCSVPNTRNQGSATIVGGLNLPHCVVFQTPEIKWSNAIEGTLFLTKSNRSTAQCFPGNNGDSTS